MKFLALIQKEFVKLARRWEDIPYDLQRAYLARHPESRRRLMATPPLKSPTSGLAVHDPQRSQSRDILKVLRSATKATTDTPIWRKYITMRDERHNKYHYFGVFPTEDGGFAAANVYGRIGYPPKGVMVIAKEPKADDAIRAAEAKLEKKMMRKGYALTSL